MTVVRAASVRVIAWAVLWTVVVPTVAVALAVQYDPELSPLDEVAHLDYLDRATRWEYPKMGDEVSVEVATLAGCRSFETRQEPTCEERGDYVGQPEDFVWDGYSYEAQHPPPYYWVSAALTRVTGLGPADNLITTGRLTGAFWLSAGCAALYLALRRLDVGHIASGLVCGLLVAGPGVLMATAKITNDATTILAGSLAVLGFTFLRERPSIPRLAAVSGIVVTIVALKPVNIIAVGAIALVLVVELHRTVGLRRAVGYAGALAGVGAFTVLAWREIVAAQASVDPTVVIDAVVSFKQKSDGPPIGQFVFHSSRLLEAYNDGSFVTGRGAAAMAVLGTVTLVSGSTALVLTGRWSTPARIGFAALAVFVAAGPLFNLQFWLDYGLRGGPAARYGLPLLPLLAVSVAGLADTSRRGRIGLAAVTVLLLVSSGFGVVLN